MAYWWLVQLVIAVAMLVISYALMPRPKRNKPPASRDLENPTAEAGRPIPVVFGTLTVKSANILWYGEKRKVDYKVRA